MPRFEIETPKGRFEVEAPDQNAAVNALQGMSTAPSQPSTLSDIGQSALSGLRQGAEYLAGGIGDVNELTSEGISYLAGKLGASPETQAGIEKYGRFLSPSGLMPTSEEINKVGNMAFGKPYQPQTTAGEYADTIGQFAPAAAISPGTIARRAALALIPGVSSETAGQATKGTSIEPYARLAGALVGGGLAAGGKGPSLVKEAAKDAPTAETLKSQTDQLYGMMRKAGITYDANAYANSVLGMANDLKKAGFRPSIAGPAFNLVDDLAKDVGKSPHFDDLNGLVQQVGQAARDAAKNPETQGLAKAYGIIRDHLDDLERNAPFSSTQAVSRDTLNQARDAARALALKNIKNRALQSIMDNADTYQSGVEAGIRNGIGNLLRSRRGAQLFKGPERQALLDVAQGRKALRTLSRFGFDLEKLSGNATLIPTAGIAAVTGLTGSPVIGGALAAAGTAAKAASPRLTQRAFDQAQAAIRSGQMNNPAMMGDVKAKQMQALIRQLLAGSAGSIPFRALPLQSVGNQ